MKDSTKKVFGLMAFLLMGGLTYSQTVLWGGAGSADGEFNAGLNNWTVNAVSDPDALWVWDAQGDGAGGAYWGNRMPIQSPSVANGAALFNSDFYDNAGIAGNFGLGVAAAPQLAELVSPVIDLTANPIISLKFNQYYRNFQSTPSVAWSNDGGTTWSDPILVNEDVAINTETARNDVQIIPLLGAGGTANFRFKFVFDANYYYWIIDDVSIIERPDFDLSLGDFFYPPASYAQPVSQIGSDSMGFSVDVSNIGKLAQDDIMLKIEILKGANVLYTDEINIGSLAAETFDTTFSFDDLFVPDMLTVGTHRLRYSVSSANTDFDNTNNSVEEEFRVTTNYYAKEDADGNFEGGLRPGGGGDYYVGNVYGTNPNWVDYYQVTKTEFSCAVNPDDPIADKAISIYLLQVNDEILPDYSNFTDMTTYVATHPDLTLIGFGEHTFSTEGNYEVVEVQLSDLEEGTPGVPIQPGKRYFLMIEYVGTANTIFHTFNTKINYFQISSLTVSDQWYLGGFGVEEAALLRMYIDLYNIADEKPLPDSAIEFYPNPASTTLNVDISLEKPALANITLADLNGRVILIDEVLNAQKESRQYDVSALPSGTYLVRIATKEGTKTKKFVVQH
ncbi:MAG: T9SS type A sorting domain-containing protein [Bacteroidetes bacterium]|nr:T9SS type A sorting domain-containing protein [Bacteroidota bacterium]